MAVETAPQASPTQPDGFGEQVKDALEHLYDLSFLQVHPLVPDEVSARRRPAEIAAQSLRRELASAIESLDPGPGVPIHDVRARVYNLLVLHYMQAMTVRETARELGISERHAYRGLRDGERLVAEVVWTRRSALRPVAADDARRAPLAAEMERMPSDTKAVELSWLLESARQAVAPLAEQKPVAIRVLPTADRVRIATNSALAEQLLIAVFSAAVEEDGGGEIEVSLAGDGHPSVLVRYAPSSDRTGSQALSQLVARLAEQLEWSVTEDEVIQGTRVVRISVPDLRFRLLVVDDNEGLAELLERYLTHYPARVIRAPDGKVGLRMAQDHVPDAIVLDVMMPGMHGWQVLQRLRNHPATDAIPVMVCSVITIPELAHALGAVTFLSKPVAQQDFLSALHGLGLV